MGDVLVLEWIDEISACTLYTVFTHKNSKYQKKRNMLTFLIKKGRSTCPAILGLAGSSSRTGCTLLADWVDFVSCTVTILAFTVQYHAFLKIGRRFGSFFNGRGCRSGAPLSSHRKITRLIDVYKLNL